MIDHRVFPAPDEAGCRADAREYGAQLVAYVLALRQVDVRVHAAWIHFAISGALVEIVPAR